MKKYLILTFIISVNFNISAQKYDWTFSAGSFVDDYAIGAASDVDSNIYLTGNLYSGTIGNTTFNDWGAYLAKFDNNGNVKWAVNFGTSDTYGVDIAVDETGNIYLTGIYIHAFTIGNTDLPGGRQPRIFLIKFDKTSKLIWAKDFGTISSSGRSYVNAISIDADNNIYLGGNFQDSIKLGGTVYNLKGRESFDSDMLLIKLSPDGDVLFVKHPCSTANEFIYDIAVNSNGIYAVGFFGSNYVEFDTLEYHTSKRNIGCILKYSLSGELEWVNTINAPLIGESYSVTLNSEGEAIVAGTWSEGNSFSDMKISITKFGVDGKELNNQLINQGDFFGNIEGTYGRKRMDLISRDNCVYLTTGLSDSVDIDHLNFKSFGRQDVALIKYNEVGFPQWLMEANGTGDDEGLRLTSDGKNIYLAGDYTSNPLAFGNFYVSNNSGNDDNDFFLAKVTDTSSIICPEIDSFKITYPSKFCEGDSVALTIKNKYATYTEWFRNQNKLNLDNEKEIFIKKEGTYKVLINKNSRCTVPEIQVNVELEKNQNENTDIVIYPKPVVDITGPEHICFGDTLSLSTYYDDNYSFKWTVTGEFPHLDTTINSLQVEMTEKVDSSVFYIEVADNQTGCINKDTFTVYIKPVPDLTVAKNINTISVYGNYIDSVLWYYEGNEMYEFTNYQSVTVDKIGYYYMIGISNFGCESMSDSIYISEISTLINPESNTGVVIHPNPAINRVYIDMTMPPKKIELLDISGTLIKNCDNESVINLENLNKGVYILKIQVENSIRYFKIIKK